MTTVHLSDRVTADDLRELAGQPGPWISLLLPTVRAGRETTANGRLFARLLERAEAELGDDELSAEREELHTLAGDNDFWQNQLDGLAVYAGPGHVETFRVPLTLAEEVSVGAAPRLVPLVPLVVEDDLFHVLVLGQNRVRLLEGHAGAMTERDLGPIPGSVDDLDQDRDDQAHLQFSAQGGDVPNYHGHGADQDARDIAQERFLRIVDDGVRRVLGADSPPPLVLAGVDATVATYRSISRHPTITGDHVSGSAERAQVGELHELAWPLVRAQLEERADEVTDTLAQRLGTGSATEDLSEIVQAGEQGRIDTLILPAERPAPDTQIAFVTDPADTAVRATLLTGGRLSAARVDAPAALLRY